MEARPVHRSGSRELSSKHYTGSNSNPVQTSSNDSWCPDSLQEAICRTARYRPEPSESGSPEKKLTPLEHITSLNLNGGVGIQNALRLQMEVQKQLHDQLEIQRNLQLWIEEQGKYLQMMFEKQNSFLVKGTASTSDSTAKSKHKKTDDSKEELTSEETKKYQELESSQPKRPKIDN